MGFNIFPPLGSVSVEVPIYSEFSGGAEGQIAKTTEDGRFYIFNTVVNRWRPIPSFNGGFNKGFFSTKLGRTMSSYTKGIVIP